MRVLSMGAGVQTTACLIKFHDQYDHVLFADTGDEKPETYWYIETYLKPFCQQHNIPWITVKSNIADSLYDFCIKEKLVPIRKKRWCTDKFKVRPIKLWMKQNGATKKNPCIQDMGISTDESHRIGPDNNPAYIKRNYPLIDARMTRADCRQIILNHGWPVPEKSGCYYCQFAPKKEIKMLAGKHPELYKKTILMQENDKDFKRIPFHDFNLRAYFENQKMDSFFDEPEEEDMMCDSGHCFV